MNALTAFFPAPLQCFSCATCRNRLMPGDRFHYINGTIFCEHDRPGAALLSSHLPPLQSNSVLTDQKVTKGVGDLTLQNHLYLLQSVNSPHMNITVL